MTDKIKIVILTEISTMKFMIKIVFIEMMIISLTLIKSILIEDLLIIEENKDSIMSLDKTKEISGHLKITTTREEKI
jgi:hypothetical protein